MSKSPHVCKISRNQKRTALRSMTDKWGPKSFLPQSCVLPREQRNIHFQAPLQKRLWPLEHQRIRMHLLAECHDRSVRSNERWAFRSPSRSIIHFTPWQQTRARSTQREKNFCPCKRCYDFKKKSSRRKGVWSWHGALARRGWGDYDVKTTGRRISAITWCWLELLVQKIKLWSRSDFPQRITSDATDYHKT